MLDGFRQELSQAIVVPDLIKARPILALHGYDDRGAYQPATGLCLVKLSGASKYPLPAEGVALHAEASRNLMVGEPPAFHEHAHQKYASQRLTGPTAFGHNLRPPCLTLFQNTKLRGGGEW